MGIAYLALGELELSIKYFSDALKLNPYYLNAAWNLCGTSKNITEARKNLESCISIDPKFDNANFTYSAIDYYEGKKENFITFAKGAKKDHPYIRSFKWIFDLPFLPKLFFHKWALFDYVIERSEIDRPFYEFGVWRGTSFKYLIKHFKKGYGFDTFTGLPEDWHHEKKGSYSSDGLIPDIEGGEFIAGEFKDTLPSFFSEKRPLASVINLDADLYSSTLQALNYSKSIIDEKTILIFDEFLMNENWEKDEYKALEEFCKLGGITYEVIAASFFSKQVAIKFKGF